MSTVSDLSDLNSNYSSQISECKSGTTEKPERIYLNAHNIINVIISIDIHLLALRHHWIHFIYAFELKVKWLLIFGCTEYAVCSKRGETVKQQ